MDTLGQSLDRAFNQIHGVVMVSFFYGNRVLRVAGGGGAQPAGQQQGGHAGPTAMHHDESSSRR